MTDGKYEPERRPIASRDYSISIRLASWIAARGVTPNAISIAGMISGVLSGLAYLGTHRQDDGWLFFLAAAALMQGRLLANMLDGMVAVQTKQASPVGELFNEVPDRVSDAAIFIGAGYALGSRPELGFWAALLAVFTAYVRAEGKVAGAKQEFCGPMAKPQRMAVLTAATVYAALAPAVWQPKLANVPDLGVVGWALIVVAVGSAFTALRRLWRIGAYLRGEPK